MITAKQPEADTDNWTVLAELPEAVMEFIQRLDKAAYHDLIDDPTQ